MSRHQNACIENKVSNSDEGVPAESFSDEISITDPQSLAEESDLADRQSLAEESDLADRQNLDDESNPASKGDLFGESFITSGTLSPVEESTKKITRRYIKGSHPARVTRISIENLRESDLQAFKPRLKQGVHVSQANSEEERTLIVASAHRAISIQHPGARAIVAKFDGLHCAADISQEIDAPVDVIEKIINILKISQLIDVINSKVRLHNRFQSPIAQRAVNTEDQSNDASFKQLQRRMSPELGQTTWMPGVIDGGVEVLSARQNFGVEIYGENRLSTLIYSALLASGVTNTKFAISTRRESSAIGDADLGTGILRTSDFGLDYSTRIEELSREWSLFPTASKNVKGTVTALIPERNIRLVVGSHPPKLIHQLMRDGLDHLFVGEVSGGATFAGPLVQPGKSPCSKCLSNGKTERYGIEGLIPISALSNELPVAIAYQVAGTTVQAILQLIDTGSCELIGAQICFDYTTPVRQELTRFSRHPKCECQWS